MRRRAFIAAAAATTTAVAGCLGNGADEPTGTDGEPTQTDEPDGTETPEPTAEETRLEDSSFEVEGVECGDEYGGHDVTVEDGEVTVEGVLDGSNSCYTAELVRGEYDSDDDTLYVEVEAVEREDAEACTQCVVEIEYVATFTFENGEPGTVSVEQRWSATGSSSAGSSVSESGSRDGEATETATPQSTGY